MTDSKDRFISLSDLWVAYRKAKAEAFYENTHFHALAFIHYEESLEANLRRLYDQLGSGVSPWSSDRSWLGGYAYAPKSVELPEIPDTERIFYRFLDPIEDWRRQWDDGSRKRVKASFRLVITPSVNFQIISALWVLKVGHKFDAVLDSNLSFGNRLRRAGELELNGPGVSRRVNMDCLGMFAPYFSAYGRWRAKGLHAMRQALEAKQRIVVVTMDLQRFYHRVNPQFLLRKRFLNTLGIELTEEETKFTRDLIDGMRCWYESTPDAKERPEGAIPVGLSASKIIANVLLTELDKRVYETVRPDYYGRYVDDVFMVVRLKDSPLSGDDVMRRMAEQLPEILKFRRKVDGEKATGLQVTLSYAKDSELIFAGSKLKVFNLSGEHGLDLVKQVSEQIRRQSSEHRLLPLLPESAEEMSSRALLAQPSANLEADALRKADAISVRRLGFSLLLRDVEAYGRDLRPNAWVERRREFYGLVNRHVVTPVGFFEFFSYIHRVFGLMVASGDFKEAQQLADRLLSVVQLLEDTTTAGTLDKHAFDACRRFYAHALLQVALQATTVARFPWHRISAFTKLLANVRRLHKSAVQFAGSKTLKILSSRLLHADWGRRPYRDYWLSHGKRLLPNPPLPSSMNVRRIVHGIRDFRRAAGISTPYWPGVAFATRPLSLGELTASAPGLLREPKKLRGALFAFRGARAHHSDGIELRISDKPQVPSELIVSAERAPTLCVAVPSILTADAEWEAALHGKPRLGIERYERIVRITNDMMREKPQPHYIAYPECSVPRSWATTIAYKLASRGISMIAGIEYHSTPKGIRNDALVSICTRWPWYASAITFNQAKMAPSHDEKVALWNAGRKRLYQPVATESRPPVYVHGDLCFGVLICSDLTNIAHRTRFQGAIDVLFVLEWNKDVESFSSLVEAAAQDLHGYVVQVNNRQFGDSRVRAPRRQPYERDSVRVKGGLSDYYVTAELDIEALRKSQLSNQHDKSNPFKPTPIGYSMSERRKT